MRYFHHLGTILLLAACILLIVPSITAPTVKDLSMLGVYSEDLEAAQAYVSLGIFGGCRVNENGSRVRYDPSQIASDALGAAISSSVDSVTGGLILAPICSGMSFIGFLLALASYAVGFICASLVAGPTFLAEMVLVVIQSVVFCTLQSNVNDVPGAYSSLEAGFWCTIAALPVLLLATCCTFAAHFHDRREKRGYFST
ncbi:hypothetical protein JCM8097_004587 [Rhodosporidiobolus ruineniae]